MSKFFCVLVSILLSPWGTLFPGNQDMIFENISIEDGLSQTSVYCIVQDKKGFMWFGTQDGLNRYDGYGFTLYKQDSEDPYSISGSNIRVICEEEEKGVLWIGTDGGGLNKFDQEKEIFTCYRHDISDPYSLSHDVVCSLYRDKSGVLWVGTWGGGLNTFDEENETFTHYKHNPSNPYSLSHDIVPAIFEDKNGTMWIGTYGGGLNKFDRETGQFIHYCCDSRNPGSLSNNKIMTIYENKAGVLWIGTDGGGLNKFERETGKFTRYQYNPSKPGSLSNDRIRAVYEDGRGVLWVGTYEGGMNRFDYKTQSFTPFRYNPQQLKSLPSDQVLSIYEDNTEMLWIGTYGGGICKLDRQKKKFHHYAYIPNDPNSLSSEIIRAIVEDPNGLLWIGTTGGGLNRLDRKKNEYTHYKHDPGNPNSLSHNTIYALYKEKGAERLWVGTFGGGLDRFDIRQGTFKHYKHNPQSPNSPSDNHVRTICEDRTGALWLGTCTGGLNKFDREKETFTHYKHDPTDPNSIGEDNILCIYQDQAGGLWIGTWGGGLNRYNQEKDNFTRYQHEINNPNCLNNNRVLSIYEDRQGMLWVGSGGKGLNKFDRKNNKWTSYSTTDGLPNDVIYGILEDDRGNLWLSSNRGLSEFNPKTETIKNYDPEDGLQSNEFNAGAYYRSRSGEMFFGGVNGFNSFYPGKIKNNPHVPPVIITDFKKFNKSVEFDRIISDVKEINLSYNDNFISFDFVALNYRSPENNQYAYMMEGFDKDWIYCGTRHTASYTNLNGGTYVFRVRGANNDGVWNTGGASVKIIITPPFWERWWFLLSVIIGVIGVIFIIYRYHTYGMRDRNKQLERINKKLNQEIIERRKVEEALLSAKKMEAVGTLAGGMAHEFNNLMSIIIGNAQLIWGALIKDESMHKRVGAILKASHRCATLTNQLLSFSRKQMLKLEKLNLNDLVRRMDQTIRRVIGSDVEVETQLLPLLEPIEGDLEMMSQVIMGIVHNARDAMPNGGRLTIKTEMKEGNDLNMNTNTNTNMEVSSGRKGKFVCLSIEDTGMGMNEDIKQHIFEPFFTTKTEGKGIGLALSFVYGTVGQHNGWLDVESTMGKGTTMTIYLPAVRS